MVTEKSSVAVRTRQIVIIIFMSKIGSQLICATDSPVSESSVMNIIGYFFPVEYTICIKHI